MSRNITDNSYTPEPMTAADSARFHACACEPARRRIPQVIGQGVMFGGRGLADVLAESTAAEAREVMRLGPIAQRQACQPELQHRLVIDLPELRGVLAQLAPVENARCVLCGVEYPPDDFVQTGYCPECDARYPLGIIRRQP